MPDMGIGRIGSRSTVYKRKFRWMVEIPSYIGFNAPMLPPHKASRPEVSFNEMKADHMVESISFPGRPEWGTLDITVYDLTCNNNKIFEWLKKLYDPDLGRFKYALPDFKASNVTLNLFDGCGNIMEKWTYENCWPQKITWGDLDMQSSEVLMVDLSLKYDRAFILQI